MKSLYYTLKGIIIYIMIFAHVSCQDDLDEDISPEPLNEERNLNLSIPNREKVEITYTGTRGSILKIYTPTIKLANPTTHLVPTLESSSSLYTIQAAATQDKDTTYVRLDSVGEENITLRWEMDKTETRRDMNGDGIEDRVAFNATSTSCSIFLKVTTPRPTTFSVNIKRSKMKTEVNPIIVWDESKDPDGGQITYSVYANDSLLIQGLQTTTYTLPTTIDLSDSVSIKVVAHTEQGSTTEVSTSISTAGKSPQVMKKNSTLQIPNYDQVIKPYRGQLTKVIKLYTPKIVLDYPPTEILAKLDQHHSHVKVLQESTSDNDTTIVKLIRKGERNLKFTWHLEEAFVLKDINEDFVLDSVTYSTQTARASVPIRVDNPPVPAPLQIIEPAQNTNNVSLQPTIRWTESVPHDKLITIKYGVHIKEVGSNSIRILAKNMTETSYKFDFALMRNTEYVISVHADDQHNHFKTTVAHTRIKTGDFNTPPTAPGNLSPVKWVTTSKPTLAWGKSIDRDQDDITYNIYLGKENPPTQKLASNLTTTSFDMQTSLERNAYYYWKVVAKDGRGGETASAITKFNVMLNSPPSSLEIISPSHRSTEVSTTPTLSWSTAIDEDEDEIVYNLYFSKGSTSILSPVPYRTELTTTSYTLPPLEPGQEYSWYVEAIDGNGGAVNTLSQSFTTASK